MTDASESCSSNDGGSGNGSGEQTQPQLNKSGVVLFEACVPGATISQERECLREIREMALDITDSSRVSNNMTVYDFAFSYVLTDRTRRKHNIKRAKDRAKDRARLQSSQTIAE